MRHRRASSQASAPKAYRCLPAADRASCTPMIGSSTDGRPRTAGGCEALCILQSPGESSDIGAPPRNGCSSPSEHIVRQAPFRQLQQPRPLRAEWQAGQGHVHVTECLRVTAASCSPPQALAAWASRGAPAPGAASASPQPAPGRAGAPAARGLPCGPSCGPGPLPPRSPPAPRRAQPPGRPVIHMLLCQALDAGQAAAACPSPPATARSLQLSKGNGTH